MMEIRIEELRDGEFMVEHLFYDMKDKHCKNLEELLEYIKKLYIAPNYMRKEPNFERMKKAGGVQGSMR